MSPLMLAVTLLVSAQDCSGSGEDVPVRWDGWDTAGIESLERELASWVAERDRRLCAARATDRGLTMTLTQLEARIDFVTSTGRASRSIPRDSDLTLFRYQVAAATEELIRVTWETLAPLRAELFARVSGTVSSPGLLGLGASVGGAYAVSPSVVLELGAGGTRFFDAGVSLTTALATLGVQWNVLQAKPFRFGPRASASGGVSVLSVPGAQGGAAGVVPFASAQGGASASVQLRHLTLGLLVEAGFSFIGAAVDTEGRRTFSSRGAWGSVALHVGYTW